MMEQAEKDSQKAQQQNSADDNSSAQKQVKSQYQMRPKTYVRNNKYSALCKLNYHKKRAQNNQNATGDNSVASNKEGKGAKFTAGINFAHKFLEDSQGGKYGNPDPQAEQKQEEKQPLLSEEEWDYLAERKQKYYQTIALFKLSSNSAPKEENVNEQSIAKTGKEKGAQTATQEEENADRMVIEAQNMSQSLAQAEQGRENGRGSDICESQQQQQLCELAGCTNQPELVIQISMQMDQNQKHTITPNSSQLDNSLDQNIKMEEQQNNLSQEQVGDKLN